MRKKLTIMVEEELTLKAKKKCIDMQVSLSDLVNRLLENYLTEITTDDK
ncbi:MAG: hypothetical protein HUJ88_11455 [Fusobacterium necrophorum]|nr:hypothetical protein [Fusobacterium necrophorum]